MTVEEFITNTVVAGIAARRGTPLPEWVIDLLQATICSVSLARGISPKQFLLDELPTAPDGEQWESMKDELLSELEEPMRAYVRAVERLRKSPEVSNDV